MKSENEVKEFLLEKDIKFITEKLPLFISVDVANVQMEKIKQYYIDWMSRELSEILVKPSQKTRMIEGLRNYIIKNHYKALKLFHSFVVKPTI